VWFGRRIEITFYLRTKRYLRIMTQTSIALLLYIYGTFLITCGIVSVLFIGMKAKTALASGGTSGLIAIFIGWLVDGGNSIAPYAGIALSIALLIVFSWRSTKTLHKVFELIPSKHPDLNGKGIAFLIISLMAVVSIFVLFLQLLGLRHIA
jgi:hypothetical protein